MPTSTTSRPGTHERPAEGAPQPVDDDGCAACPHPVTAHDAIGLRYCRATQATGADRGCVCRND